MSVSDSDIDKIAQLARIGIDQADLHEVAQRINSILAMVDEMQAVDTDDVEPMAHPLDATQRLRADEVTEINRRDAFQAIAPNSQDGLYLVPKVIE
jgi:aspartyl-tRNA(Asn)/glutamyl-tRNA(Gln) amidotransferase subunit C